MSNPQTSMPPTPREPMLDKQGRMSMQWDRWIQQLQRVLSFAGGVGWGIVDKGGSKLSDIETRPHSALQSILGWSTGIDADQNKHISQANGKVWQDHVEITDGNPHGTGHSQLDSGIDVDVADAIHHTLGTDHEQAARGDHSHGVYDVLLNGLEGDAAYGYTGATTATSTTFTDPNATFTGAINGKTILIYGAGAGGNLHQCTVTFVSATQLTLSSAAVTTTSDTEYIIGTDDGPALQALVDAYCSEMTYIEPYNVVTTAAGIWSGLLKTRIVFPGQHKYLIATPVVVSRKDCVVFTGDGLIVFPDIQAITLQGCRYCGIEDLYFDGMQHHSSPTTSTICYLETASDDNRRTDLFVFRNNKVQRVKHILKTSATPVSGPDVIVENNIAITWTVADSRAFDFGNRDNYCRFNKVYGFKYAFYFADSSVTWIDNHIWGSPENSTTDDDAYIGAYFGAGKVHITGGIVSSNQRAGLYFSDNAIAMGHITITGVTFYRNTWSINPLIDHAAIEFDATNAGTPLDNVVVTNNDFLMPVSDTQAVKLTNIDTASSTGVIDNNNFEPTAFEVELNSGGQQWTETETTLSTDKFVTIEGSTFPVARIQRNSDGAIPLGSAFSVTRKRTDGVPAAGFGSGFILQGMDNNGNLNNFAALYGVNETFGANTGASKGGFELGVFNTSGTPTKSLSGTANGNVMVGNITDDNAAKLQVDGAVKARSVGFVFPDGTTQATAATGGGLTVSIQTAAFNASSGNHYLCGGGTAYAATLADWSADSKFVEFTVRAGVAAVVTVSSANLEANVPTILKAGDTLRLVWHTSAGKWQLDLYWPGSIISTDPTNGRVGIGTTAPQNPFHVVGAIAAGRFERSVSSTTAYSPALNIHNSDTTTNNVICLALTGVDSASNVHSFAGVGCQYVDHTNGAEKGDLVLLALNLAANASIQERVRFCWDRTELHNTFIRELNHAHTFAANDTFETVATIALVSGEMISGHIEYGQYASNTTPDYQIHRGRVSFEAVNKGGVYTTNILHIHLTGNGGGTELTTNISTAVGGTIVDDWQITTGTNLINIQAKINSSLTGTVTRVCKFQLRLMDDNAITAA